MTTDKKVGLYVHIPFCIKKCNYCDFCSFPERNFPSKKEYIDALIAEIESYSGKNILLDSIFFGGGTPSVLEPFEFSRIIETIRRVFLIDDNLEFTVEANPKTLSGEKLSTYKSLGVNRISMGMQSIHEKELKKLGRIHSFEDFLESYKLVQASGIDNVNVDVMYGIPEQNRESFEQTLKTLLELRPSHISVYGLILEEGTPFFENKESLVLPSDDEECDMYYLASELLKSHGYNHYEISNYALDGAECRHNIKYWRCDDYIGVGLSAYSLFEGRRFGNTDDYGKYVNGENVLQYDEVLDTPTKAYEYVMLHLRTAEGFSLREYKELFGMDFCKGREKTIEKLIDLELLEQNGDVLSLSEKGFYVSNAILTELI